MENYLSIVSSRGLLRSCNLHSKEPRSTNSVFEFTPAALHVGGSVYVCTDALEDFANRIHPVISAPYVLVTGDSDLAVDDLLIHSEVIRKLLDNPLVLHWHAQNLLTSHPKISHLPIGLDYHTAWERPSLFEHARISPFRQERELLTIFANSPSFENRQNIAYCNWKLTANRGDRLECLLKIEKNAAFIEDARLERHTTWARQANYAFVLSPSGVGADCHRTWEAIMTGSIPIIKSGGLSPMFAGLPVVQVADWSVVTKQWLAEIFLDMREKKFDFTPMFLGYWQKRLQRAEPARLPEMTLEEFRDFITKSIKLTTSSASKKNAVDKPIFVSQNSQKNSIKKRAIFVGCVKNSAARLTNVLENIDRLTKRFSHSAYVFVENDSTDNTLEILRDWGQDKKDFAVHSLTGLDAFIAARTLRLEICRNLYLAAIRKMAALSENDVVVMLDMDNVNATPIDVKSFESALEYLLGKQDVAVVTAMQEGPYYDLWALRHPEYFNFDIWEDVLDTALAEGLSDQQAYQKVLKNCSTTFISREKPTVVDSAFGGLGIYKLDALMKNPIPYCGQHTKYLLNGASNFFRMQRCEHVSLNLGFKSNGMKVVIHPELINQGYGPELSLNPSAFRTLIL